MSNVEELEQIIARLPPKDFEALSLWIARRRAALGGNAGSEPMMLRDHGAFLNSYTAEDEGLYDNAETR